MVSESSGSCVVIVRGMIFTSFIAPTETDAFTCSFVIPSGSASITQSNTSSVFMISPQV